MDIRTALTSLEGNASNPVAQLTAINDVLTFVNARMNIIKQGVPVPPPTDLGPMLQAIVGNCSTCTQTAQSIMPPSTAPGTAPT